MRLSKFPGKLLVSTAALLFLAQGSLAAGFLDNLELETKNQEITESEETGHSLSGNFLAAQIAAGNNDSETAIEYFKEAIAQDPENTGLKQSLFVSLTADGLIAEAIEILNSLPAEAQDKPVNHVVSAADAIKKKSWARAVTAIDNVSGTDLDSMLSKILGSWALFGERKIDEAIARAQEVSGPDWTIVIKDYHVGLMLSAIDRDKEAIAHLQKAVENRAVAAALTETYIRALEALARAHVRSGDKAKAVEVVDEGLSLLPTHPPLLLLQEKLKGEDAILPLVTSAQQGAGEIFFNVGSAISRQGGLPFAQSHLQLAHFLDPKSNVALLSLANVYEGQRKFERANSYYKLIPEESPHYRRAQLEIGLNLNQMEKTGEAISLLESVVEAQPDDLIAVSSLGSVFAQHKKYDQAARLYEKTIPLLGTPDERHWTLFYRRGIAYERTKQWPKAEADFRKALELSPDQADVLNYLGYSWVDMGINLDEGLEMIKKAVELKPNSGFIIDSLGWVYYRLGRYEEAVKELERALELMPTDPVVNDHLGDAYWKTGRKLEATFLWKHALGNKPEEKDRIVIEKKLREGLTN